MNHIVKDIIAYTNEKTPIYKIIYAEPTLEKDINGLALYVEIKSIILDYNTWTSNLPNCYVREDDFLLERWNNLIDKEKPDIDKDVLTGIIDPEDNCINCRKLSIQLLN